MTERERIIDRIKKCLALSKSPNVHESALALQRAYELMEKYEVDDRELALHGITHRTHKAGDRVPIEQRYVNAILKEFFQVQVLVPDRRAGAGNVSIIIGEPFRIEIATYVQAFLVQTFRRLWRDYRTSILAKTWNRYKPANRRKLHEDFIEGAYIGLRDTLLAGLGPAGEGLVPIGRSTDIERYAKEHFNPTSTKGKPRKWHSPSIAGAGFAAGRTVRIRDGMREAAEQKQIIGGPTQ